LLRGRLHRGGLGGGGRSRPRLGLEAPLHLSNVQIVCPSCDAPVRVGFRFHEEGRKVRYCKKCDQAID